jgi:hypothetical protein
MTKDDILRIAKEADVWVAGRKPYQTQLERFADLILEHLRWDGIHTCSDQCQRPVCVAVREAVKAERDLLIREVISIADRRGAYQVMDDIIDRFGVEL